jgi:hypothetical protein
MAFYAQEDEDQQAANASAPSAQTQSGSSVITGDSSAGGGPSAPKTNAPDRPGNFVNLQQYLNANKSQAGKLGDQASGVINQSANQAREGVNSLNQEASQRINPVQNLSSDVSNKIKTGAENLTPEERAQVKNTEKASYTGPQSYTDLNAYQSAADANQKAQQNITNSGTEQGRMSLISQINSKPRTQGMTVFDNALLQAGGGRQKLAQTADANKDLGGVLQNATQGIQNQIGRADDPSTPDIDESSGAIGQTNKAQADAYKQVQDALSGWTAGFQPKVSAAQNALVDKQNMVSGDLAKNPYKLNNDELSMFGLTPETRMYNLDLKNYLNQASPSDINAGNVASAEDYARYGALADLAGEQNPLLNQADVAKAGTAPTAGADQAKLRSDLQAADTKYQNDYSKQSQQGIVEPGIASRLAGNLAGTIGGVNIAQATPEQLENSFLPAIKKVYDEQGVYDYGYAYNSIAKALDDWKKSQGYNHVLNAIPDLPTGSDGQIDWSQIKRPLGK